MLTVERERYVPFMSSISRFRYCRIDRCYLRVDILIAGRNELFYSLDFYPTSIKNAELRQEEISFNLCQYGELV